MSQKLNQAGHWIVNVAIVVVAICIVILTVSKFLDHRSNRSAQQLHVGDAVALPPDLRGQPVLLIALQAGCHFCEESMPFYKSINDESASLKGHLLFAFPSSAASGQAVLSANGIPAKDVRQMDFPKLGVSGTPTVLLISAQGKVDQVWIGKLNSTMTTQFQQTVRQ